jgi:hypothetical protein
MLILGFLIFTAALLTMLSCQMVREGFCISGQEINEVYRIIYD